MSSLAKTRTFIIDNILTLHCPRCKIAFLDFDGCPAVTCRMSECACDFCGICLGERGHLGPCSRRQIDIDIPWQQNMCRCDKIAEYLKPLDAAFADDVLRSLRVDLEGVGLRLAEVRQALAAARQVRWPPGCP